MLCPTYTAKVVSDASHGFDTCKLEVTKPTLNDLLAPQNNFQT